MENIDSFVDFGWKELVGEFSNFGIVGERFNGGISLRRPFYSSHGIRSNSHGLKIDVSNEGSKVSRETIRLEDIGSNLPKVPVSKGFCRFLLPLKRLRQLVLGPIFLLY